jgi:arylsulfatase A
MTDAGTRVPLIAHWPGVINTGKVSKNLVDFSDFLPTLCEAAGAEIPAELAIDGRSFLAQLQGEKGNPREWIYCWYSRNGKSGIQEWARNQRYKLYRTGEFYDISQDRLEKTPLTEFSAEAQQVRAMLQQTLDQYKDARPGKAAPEKKRKARKQ